MSDWLIQRDCIDCGGECCGDVGFPEPRCGTCWINHTGASHDNSQFRIKPPRVQITGRKKLGRYIKGTYVYWDEVSH